MSDWHPKFMDFLSQEYHRLKAAYNNDSSFKDAVHGAMDQSHPTPQAVIAAQAARNAQQISEAKPSPKQPWDEWDDNKKMQMDKALEALEGVQLYRRAGGLGIAKEWEPLSNQISQQGGISPEQATILSRYRQFKQGATDIPIGDRQPSLTDEEKDARRQSFFASSPEQRAQMLAQDKVAAQRELAEGHFDGLVAPRPAAPPPSSPPISQAQPQQPMPQKEGA